MPRRYPPTPVLQPPLEPFVMDSIHHRILAQTLGLTHLPGSMIEGINDVIGRYKAIQYGNRDTTVGNTLAALKGLYRPGGRAYKKAVERLANDRSGVDDTTLDPLQPLAQEVIDNDPQTPKALAATAETRTLEIQGLPIEPKTEYVRSFFG